MTPFAVVCWKWETPPLYRSVFGPEVVNTLRRMVQRHFDRPHRFICVTDNPAGLDPDVEVVSLWNDFSTIWSPHGNPSRYPSCYRRLRAFHPAIAKVFGPRFVQIDLDLVVTGDLAPLWDRPEDFVIWGDTNPHTLYNSSMILMTAGTRSQVWTDFNPQVSPGLAKQAGNHGSDQAWISYRLGPGEAKWTRADGVYSFRNEIAPVDVKRLPDDARIVMFHGQNDPWNAYVQQNCPWVREYYGVVPRQVPA